jgi:hypothetical protein
MLLFSRLNVGCITVSPVQFSEYIGTRLVDLFDFLLILALDILNKSSYWCCCFLRPCVVRGNVQQMWGLLLGTCNG